MTVAVVILWSAALAFFLSALRPASAQTTQPQRGGPDLHLPAGHDHETIELSRASGWLLARVSVNGQNAGWFLIDTGAGGTFIDEEVAAKLGLTALAGLTSVKSSTNAQVSGKAFVMRSLSIGPISSDWAIADGISFGSMSTLSGVPISGAIGIDVLSALPFTLDYRKSTITFHRREAFRPPTTTQPYTVRMSEQSPLVEVSIAGRHGWFELDTGSADTLEVWGPFAAMNLDRFAAHPLVPSTAWNASGKVTAFETRIEDVGFLGTHRNHVGGSVTLTGRDYNLSDLGMVGTIGSGLLRRNARLTIDLQNGKIWPEWQERLACDEQVRLYQTWAERDLAGTTALKMATQDDRADAVKALLDAGADPNAADHCGFTPLMSAGPECCRLLLASHADPNAQSAVLGLTPLVSAAGGGEAQVVKALLASGANFEKREMTGETALLRAVQAKSLESAAALIAAGADVNAADKEDVTPLMTAALWNDPVMAKLLLEHAADPDRRNKTGRSALMVAASNGYPAVVGVLLSHGASVNLRYEKTSALHLAVVGNDAAIIRLLLAAGAKRDAVDEAGRTAVQVAIAKGNLGALRALLDDSPATQPATRPAASQPAR